jgi:hypothetical protein
MKHSLKHSLRLPEREIPGVLHGYSLADNTFLHLLDRFYQVPEGILLRTWVERTPIDRPIFIVGPYRSETTILQEIITSHPDVGYFWYLTNIFSCAPVFSYYTTQFLCKVGLLHRDPIAPVHNPAIPTQILSPFECESVWLPTGHSLWNETCRNMLLDADFSDLPFERHLRRLIRSHLFVSKTTRFLNKNPVNSLCIAYLNKLFPDVRFINIVRNPLETAISHYRTAARVEKAFDKNERTRYIFHQHLYIDMLSRRIRTSVQPDTQALDGEHPLLGIASQWVGMQQAVLNAVTANPNISLLDIRYEDLVHQPAQTLDQVWGFLELEGEEAATVTTKYIACLSPRPPVELTSEEKNYLPRILEILSPTAGHLGYSFVDYLG